LVANFGANEKVILQALRKPPSFQVATVMSEDIRGVQPEFSSRKTLAASIRPNSRPTPHAAPFPSSKPGGAGCSTFDGWLALKARQSEEGAHSSSFKKS
jgi:hypothetical protein